MATKQDIDPLVKFGNHVDLLHPSKYLKACDLRGKEVTVIIEHINPRDDLQMRNGKTEKKPTIKFRGHDKLLCLNRTNAQAIAKIHGPELTKWLDKAIVIYPTRVKFGREEVDAIRIKAANGKSKLAPSDPPEMDPDTGEFPDNVKPQDPPADDEFNYGPPPMEPGSNG